MDSGKILVPPPFGNELIREYFKQYNPQFETYVCLSPFLKWPPGVNLQLLPGEICYVQQAVDDSYIDDPSHYLSWQQIAQQIRIDNLRYFHPLIWQASEGRNKTDPAIQADGLKLKQYLQSQNIDYPYCGDFPSISEPLFLQSFLDCGVQQIYVGDEFAESGKYFQVQDLLNEPDRVVEAKANVYRTFCAADNSMAYTAPWDSFFVLLTAVPERIELILEKYGFEGFWADDSTDCFWGFGEK